MDRDDFVTLDALDLDEPALDVHDAALDLGDAGDAPPPADTSDEDPRRRSADALAASRSNQWLTTFIVTVFCVLELQAILVILGTADGGAAEAVTYAFSGVFLASVMVWYMVGGLWFAKRFEAERRD